jgi:MFS family permease
MLSPFNLKSRNLSLFFTANFLGGLLFFLPVVALYMERELFTLQNVALVFSVRAVLSVLLEVPTGAIADLFGRVMTIRFAFAVFILSVVTLYTAGDMGMFMVHAFFWALGMALASGTDNAFIYDTLKDDKRESEYKEINGFYRVMWMSGAAVGSVFGGYMASYSLELPILLSLIPVTLAFFVTLGLKEPSYEKEDHKNIFAHMVKSSKIALKKWNIALLSLIGFLLVGFSEVTHMMKAIFYEFNGVPLVYFGYLGAATFLFASLGFYFSHWISERVNERFLLAFSTLFGGVMLICATYVGSWQLVALLMVLPAFVFGLRWPIIDDIVNRDVTSNVRATVMSLLNFSRQLGTAIMAPFLGYFADLYSIEAAFRLSGVAVIFIALLFLGLKAKKNV